MLQFQRQEQAKLAEIDTLYQNRHLPVTLTSNPLHQISQCSLTLTCRLLPCVPETDDIDLQQASAVHIQRISRGGRGRRKAKDRRFELNNMRNNIANATFQVNIMDKVEKSAADHKIKEMRARARLMLEIADVDSAQFRWYAKLQRALQYVEEQKEAVCYIFASAGVLDPHENHCEDPYEPACRSLQELRQKQRRHPLDERAGDDTLIPAAKRMNLPLYARDTTENMGEHLYSVMGVFGRLGTIQQETKRYFEEIARIEKDVMKCLKDEATWRDPTVCMSYTKQEIDRHRNAIKETRGRVDEEMKELKDTRVKGRKRRASLSRVEQLSDYVVETRGRQKLRSIARRRHSVNLKEARVDKGSSQVDRKMAKMLRDNKAEMQESLNVMKCLSFCKDVYNHHSLEVLLDEEVLHSLDGNASYEKWLKVTSLGYMDVDTYNLREAEMKGRSRSLCAPERVRESRELFIKRLEGFEKIWEMAAENNIPPLHSTVWGDEPVGRRGRRPRMPNSDTR